MMSVCCLECEEEAGIKPSLASKTQPVGAVSYASLDEAGNVRRDCLFCFDLELPIDFEPVPVDGEVKGVNELSLWFRKASFCLISLLYK